MTPTAELLIPEVVELIREGAYSELREALHHVPPADVAEIFASIEPKDAAVAFRFLQRDDAGEVFSYLAPEKQQELIHELGAEGARRVIENMSVDDRARLLDELPAEAAQRLIATLSPEDRKVTQAILGYPPRSVGRLMTPDYISLRPDWTVQQAITHIRKNGRDAEIITYVYVVDDKGVLLDDIHIRQLLLAEPEQTLRSIMTERFVCLVATDDQSEAVRVMAKHDRVALPVVDSRKFLVGIVTYDDVADIAELEVTEDIQKIGGMQALEEPFKSASVLFLVKKRAPWLALLFLSEILTTNALSFFESEIERAAVLATFVPAIISAGGNSGSQASTLVIRALATADVTLADWWRVLRRELACGAILGLIVGGIAITRINLWGWLGWWTKTETDPETGAQILNTSVQQHYSLLGVAIMTSLLGVVLWGSIMGAMLPFIMKRLGLDPAASSTPFVATLVDVTGIIIYFTCALFILRGTLL